MNMPLAPGYTFVLSPGKPGVKIDLFHTESGAHKQFYAAGASHDGVKKFMESLTDSQCEQHLSIKAHGKKEKK